MKIIKIKLLTAANLRNITKESTNINKWENLDIYIFSPFNKTTDYILSNCKT